MIRGAEQGRMGIGIRATLASVLLALVLAFVFGSASALAVQTRPLGISFGGKGSEDGQFEGPAGVAVSEASLSKPAEDVYVVDRGNNRIEQFSSTGAFIAAWGWGVSNGKAEYEVCTSGCRAGIAGSGVGQLDSPEAIAVDNSTNPLDPSVGDVYVTNTADNAIEKFGPAGEYIGQLTEAEKGSPFSGLYGVAVDPKGELWVYQPNPQIDNFSDAVSNVFIASRGDNFGTNPGFAVDSEDNFYVVRGSPVVAEVNSSGATLIEQVDPETATGVAVESSTNNVYIDNATIVNEYSPGGSFIGSFGSGDLHSGSGLAVSSSANVVYVADSATDTVDIFTAAVTLPTVTVEAASGVEKKPGTIVATLNGSVNPESVAVSECYFEYGTTLPSGDTVPCEPAPGSSATAVAVHATVGHLAGGSGYSYRLVAKNINGPNSSGTETFQTPATVTLSVGQATGVQKHSGQIEATLNGSVNPESVAVSECYFEYGTTLPSGDTVPCEPAPGSSAGAVAVHAVVSRLAPNTTYSYRLVAQNEFGPTASGTETLQAPVAVTLSVEKATAVQKHAGQIEATLSGSVNPESVAVSECYFEYGTTLPSGDTVPCEPAPGSSAGAVAVHAVVSHLTPDSTYNFRLVAKNEFGTETSPTEAFQTPVAVNIALRVPSGIGENSETDKVEATLNATVNPEGEAVSECYFEYGTSLPSGKTADCEPLPGAGSARVEVKAVVSGLEVEEHYDYRLVGKNAVGQSEIVSSEGFQTPAAVSEVSGCGAIVLNESATLQATLEPNRLKTTWYFEYREAGSSQPWVKTPEGEIEKPAREAAKAEAKVKGLIRNTPYECKLVAHNLFGTSPGPVGGFVTALPPEVEGESFTSVGFSTVTLVATVNVWGAPDTYSFEYATQKEFETTKKYSQSTPPLVVSHPARGERELFVQIPGGLQPSENYDFRVVVTQPEGGGTATGADDTFGTFPESGFELPDGRAYELVSPAEARGANVYVPEAHNGSYPTPTELPFQAATDGEAVAYVGAPSAGGDGDAGEGGGNEYLATRSASGWSSADLMPSSGGTSPAFLGFSGDLSVGFLESREPLSEGAPGGGFDVLYSRASSGAFGPLFTENPQHRSAEEFESFGTVGPAGAGLAYAGASANSEDVLFEANDALIRGASDPGADANDLYESIGGHLSLVNEVAGKTVEATFGAPNETGDPEDPPDFSNVISADGSLIFWTDLTTGEVYVREHGTENVPVSAGAARYWTATPDGHYAFYTEGEKLYKFDVEDSDRAELVGAGAGVLGVIGTSEDGEYVYFVAEGALAKGATAKEPNLYLLHAGATTFVATLAPEGADGDEGNTIYGDGHGSFGDWEPGLGHRTAEVTPNGHSIVFQSVRSLTGYDSDGLTEVFVYDSESGGGLFCASCDPSGEPPQVTEVDGSGVKSASYLPVSWSRTYMPRWISEDGSRVFFDTFEPLVAADSNGQQDVYEWERPNAGECQAAKGCDYLFSGATSRSGSYLVDASANGNDVFFVTDARLVPQDENESQHLYDDRVGGLTPQAPSACSGNSCQQLPVVPPIFSRPPSSTFIGVGNFPPGSSTQVIVPPPAPPAKACKKGFVKKNGKCVKKKATKTKKKTKAKHAKKSTARRARKSTAGARRARRKKGRP